MVTSPPVLKLAVLALSACLSRERYACIVDHNPYRDRGYSNLRKVAHDFFVYRCGPIGNLPPKKEFLDQCESDFKLVLEAVQGLSGLTDHEMNALVGRGMFRLVTLATRYAVTTWTHGGSDHVADLFDLRQVCAHKETDDGAACAEYLVYVMQLVACARLAEYRTLEQAYRELSEIPS